MKTRLMMASVVTVATLLALTGCFGGQLPGPAAPDTSSNEQGETSSDLTNTRWSGTDTDGDFTIFEFQPDGTVGVTYSDETFDAPTDTWAVSGDSLTVIVYLSEESGNAVYQGTINGDAPIEMSGKTDRSGNTFELTLTKQ